MSPVRFCGKTNLHERALNTEVTLCIHSLKIVYSNQTLYNCVIAAIFVIHQSIFKTAQRKFQRSGKWGWRAKNWIL